MLGDKSVEFVIKADCDGKQYQREIDYIEAIGSWGAKFRNPDWLLSRIEENVSKMLSGGVSNRVVSGKLIGGLRAIYDSSSPADEDPVVVLISQIVEEIDSSVSS